MDVGTRVRVSPRGGCSFFATVISIGPYVGVIEDNGSAWYVDPAILEEAIAIAKNVCPCCDGDASTCGHAPCAACKGTGSSCVDCKGTGEYVGYAVVERCKTCDGARCEACGGSGW